MVGLADLLLRSPLASHQQDMVRALISAAESVGQLSQDLLDRGRAESGELRLSLHPVSLRKLALNLEQLYSVQARSKGIGFALELDQSLPETVLADGERLQQVLTNLLSNALKFTDSGQISLALTRLRSSRAESVDIRFAVADSGAGLSAADRERLFEPFSKGSRGREHSFGAGLGLSICQDLVSLMGGEISVESELGAGTRMSFILQLSLAEPSAKPRPAEPVASDHRARVLVVDDDPDLQLLYAAQIKALGAEVDCVDGEVSCMDACQGTRYDLVVLDEHLKRGELGSELAARVANRCGRRTRVVIVSGSPVPDELPNGVDQWMTKPMRMEQIARIIDAVSKPRRSGGQRVGRKPGKAQAH